MRHITNGMTWAATAALLAGLTIVGGTASGEEAGRDKPNVVVLFIDDLGWKDLGVYGSKFFETPRIDQLAKQGALFTRAYSSCNVCSPTGTSLLTGKYPPRIGFTSWLNPRKPNGPNSAALDLMARFTSGQVTKSSMPSMARLGTSYGNLKRDIGCPPPSSSTKSSQVNHQSR